MSQTDVLEKIKTYVLDFVTFYRESCHMWDDVDKYCGQAGHKGQYTTAHAYCILDI